MEEPKVSIIIPVYNGEKYIQIAIDSALRQTYKNIEIIVVNDGSKDKTRFICGQYKDKIRYFEKENGGASTALNVGIQNMTGDYFSWLSHDDIYYPEKVATEIEYIKNHNLMGSKTIVYSDYSFIDGKGRLKNDVRLDTIRLNSDSAFSITTGALNGLSLLIPKEAFNLVGLFDENLRCLQDYALWFKMYKEGYKFVHIPEVLVATRVHEKQVTVTNSNMKKEGTSFWFDVINYFSDSEKIRLYGSVYNYYYDLYKTFNGGSYEDVINYCQNKYSEIETEVINSKIDKKISIVIPFYNNVEQCVESLKSVLNQTYKNLEVLLINNGSSENIDLITRAYSNNDLVMFKSYNAKKKDYEIWNDAIKEATGDFIVFFNSYNVMERDRIEIQLLKTIASGFVASHTSYSFKNGEFSDVYNVNCLNGEVIYKLIEGYDANISTFMIDRKYLIENNIFFEGENHLPDKWLIYSKILKNNRILGIEECLTIVNEKVKENSVLFDENNAIMNHITTDIDYRKYRQAISKRVKNYADFLNKKDYCANISHKEELNRYEYMLTDEWLWVQKVRRFIGRILKKNEKLSYEIDNGYIDNSRLNKIYKKIKRR